MIELLVIPLLSVLAAGLAFALRRQNKEVKSFRELWQHNLDKNSKLLADLQRVEKEWEKARADHNDVLRQLEWTQQDYKGMQAKVERLEQLLEEIKMEAIPGTVLQWRHGRYELTVNNHTLFGNWLEKMIPGIIHIDLAMVIDDKRVNHRVEPL